MTYKVYVTTQLSYLSMMVNKFQGQTFDKIGLYIDQNKSIFEYGQLYIALSRCLSKDDIKVQIVGAKNDVGKVSVKNVVFKEVL